MGSSPSKSSKPSKSKSLCFPFTKRATAYLQKPPPLQNTPNSAKSLQNRGRSLLDFSPLELLTNPKYQNPHTNSSFSRIFAPKTFDPVFHAPPDLFHRHFNYKIACKKGIKYTSQILLSSSQISNPGHSKLYKYLKNLKICRSIELTHTNNSSNKISLHSKLRLRKHTLHFSKSLKNSLNTKGLLLTKSYKTLQTFNTERLPDIKYLPKLRNLQLNKLSDHTKSFIGKISKLQGLETLKMSVEDFLFVLFPQRKLSKAVLGLHKLTSISLSSTVTQPNLSKIFQLSIQPQLPFWRKVTELNIKCSDVDLPLKSFFLYLKRLDSLKKFSLKSKPLTIDQLPAYAGFETLHQLTDLNLSIKMSEFSSKDAVKLFEHLSFPLNLKSLDLKITRLKSCSAIDRVSKTYGFFSMISNLSQLLSFKLHLKVKDKKPKVHHIRAPFLFSLNLVQHLPRTLQKLSLTTYHSVLSWSSAPLISQDNILYTIATRLTKLEEFHIDLLGANLEPTCPENKVLRDLKKMSLGNLVLTTGFWKNFNLEGLVEIKCTIKREIEAMDLEWFLRELNVFPKLRVFSLNVLKVHCERLTYNLGKELLRIYQELKELRELYLSLPSVYVNKDIAGWFLQLCRFKRSLECCKVKFRDCRISKDMFEIKMSESIKEIES